MKIETIMGFIDANRVIGITKDLINRNSENPSGNNESNEVEVAQYIYDFFKDLNIDVEKQISCKNRFNVIARMKSDTSLKTLAFNGHTDVVPIGDISLWNTDPFNASIADNKIYGRGACDMKASIACFMHAMEIVKINNLKLKHNTVFTAVIDEEKSNMGINTLLSSGFNPDYCIVGEPTSCKIQIGHRGVLALDIIVTGIACHAAMTSIGQGRNAILDAIKIVDVINNINSDLKKHKSELLGSSQLNVTQFRSGVKVNIIPDQAIISIDGRTAHGEKLEDIINLINSKLENLKSSGEILDYKITPTTYCPSYEINTKSKFLSTCIEHNFLLNNDDSTSVFGATCEASLIASRGSEVVIYGAGNLQQAHNANEYVSINDLIKTTAFYIASIIE